GTFFFQPQGFVRFANDISGGAAIAPPRNTRTLISSPWLSSRTGGGGAKAVSVCRTKDTKGGGPETETTPVSCVLRTGNRGSAMPSAFNFALTSAGASRPILTSSVLISAFALTCSTAPSKYQTRP